MELSKIIEKMKAELKEEIDGIGEYIDMAHEAKEMNQHDLAKHYYEMAGEEYTHAKCIESHLKHYGEIPTMEDVKKLHEMEARLSKSW